MNNPNNLSAVCLKFPKRIADRTKCPGERVFETPDLNNAHGRSQGKIFTEANKLITSLVGMFVNVVNENLTSCPYLI